MENLKETDLFEIEGAVKVKDTDGAGKIVQREI